MTDPERQLRQERARALRWLADQIESGGAPLDLAEAVLGRGSAPAAEAWSPPMTKARMMGKLGLGHSAFDSFAGRHGLRRINRQLYQIRLDAMDAGTRRKFEK